MTSQQIDFLDERPASDVHKAARISDCGLYRYWLTRQWGGCALLLPIIMLNPSTADAAIDDPTIRRCISFAKREGYGGISVSNLFAFRAASPDDMKAASDPIGPDNDDMLDKLFVGARAVASPVLAAWGAHGDFRNRARDVRGLARAVGVELVCLGATAAGHPRHPLYVKGDQPFVPFA